MPQSGFYAKVRQGMPALIDQWRQLGQGDPDRLALILAETAQVAHLGEPEVTPDGEALAAWSQSEQGDDIPLWAARTATFLLIQMPARPEPKSDEEACAWAYCWLRNRDFENVDAARAALPMHLQEKLTHAVGAAWADRQGLRLV
ncbi:hypothetical protein [Billgrantia kenyensis]|uniref:Uncharacterized protein n=1 Tax=Billgrantia kenyensis TaxID=321266 RepID=A0A7V9VZC8_9GAMM|nr:hypothetical protein [Halomonas kenyensis]MBA2778219.1 hypothetical protein [Halomonas kenyensis]MCG6661002.1 hypothetical protein [Halomonas kenyensis]